MRAELFESKTCSAAGITVHGRTPVLTLCRRLLAVGTPAEEPLELYRGSSAAGLALRVRSIGEAAKLTVTERPAGGLRLEAWRADDRNWDADPGRAETTPVHLNDEGLPDIGSDAERTSDEPRPAFRRPYG